MRGGKEEVMCVWGEGGRSPIAVVRSRPYSEDCFIKVPLVALHDQLVGSTYH